MSDDPTCRYAFFENLRTGNISGVKAFLDHKTNRYEYAKNEATALGLAAASGRKDVVAFLLDRGAEINCVADHSDGTALCAAAHQGWDDVVELLLYKGADINLVGGHYGTALGAAAHQRHKHIVTYLLYRGADINLVGGDYGTALGAAAHQGQVYIVRMLLQRGADINLVGGHYGTALGVAAASGQKNVVAFLLDRGADINLVGGDYGTALGAAAYRGEKDVVNYLLLDKGADINLVGGHYGTALGAAAHQGHVYIVQTLLQRGADINLVGGDYGTALGAAAHQGQVYIVQTLLQRGADINLVGGDYGTALGAASLSGNIEVMVLLLDRGADINLVGGDYGTALGAALKSGNIEVMVLLLDRGADMNLVCGDYGTVLGLAAYRQLEDVVSLLLARGADVMHVGGSYVTNSGGYPTAFDAAEAGGAKPSLLAILDRARRTLSPNAGTGVENVMSPPFPMPYFGSNSKSFQDPEQPEISTKYSYAFSCRGNLRPVEANVLCKHLAPDSLRRSLIALVGICEGAAGNLQKWMENDVRYFVSQGFDLGLAYAAARVGWKHFNESGFQVALQRCLWRRNAFEIDRKRRKAIYKDETGQELIKSPYSIMPRRIWDLKSNRVVDFKMLQSEFITTRQLAEQRKLDVIDSRMYPTFWAVTHSWTNSMQPIKTPVNQYQWLVPVPVMVEEGCVREQVNIDRHIREELLGYGAEYVWLDVLCLRQQTAMDALNTEQLDAIRQEEWKLDVPTIGNIYRKAKHIVRYFNGLGIPFIKAGWDDPRHWLQRAWTLQEIKTESTTYNGGVFQSSAHIILHGKGKLGNLTTTMRRALRPVLRLAAKADSPTGCSVYDLMTEMAKRYATQEVDMVAGTLYLLRPTQLPIYDATLTDEAVWGRCIHLLPLHRKLELLCDYPYRGGEQQWYPTWKQLMKWPAREPDDYHTPPSWKANHSWPRLILLSGKRPKPNIFFVPNLWAMTLITLKQLDEPGEYYVQTGGRTYSFYCPYPQQEQIIVPVEGSQLTLAVQDLEHTYNWVVCEALQKQSGILISLQRDKKEVEVHILKKVGVLKTDSCSMLLAGIATGASVLERMHACII